MVIAGVWTSFGEVQHECGSASVQTQNKKKLNMGTYTMCSGGVLWCGCHWFSPKRTYQGCVFSPTAGVAEHFLHIFFEARLGSLRCSSFRLQFTISLHDFFVTLLIGSCALASHTTGSTESDIKGDLVTLTKKHGLREALLQRKKSLIVDHLWIWLFVCHLSAVCTMLPERFGWKKHPDGDLRVF